MITALHTLPARPRFFSLLSAVALVVCSLAAATETTFRPPAVPLVPVDPFFSIWSPADKLTDAATMHWTEAPNRLTSLVRIDGNSYRILGDEPKDVPALPQTHLETLPTTVTYTFEGAGVRVSLAFMTPLLPEDLMLLSRPVTYLTWQVQSTDGQQHDVQIHYDNTAELVVNRAAIEPVTWATEKFGDVTALKVGSVEQNVLHSKGDRVRINWGYQYVAVPASQNGRTFFSPADAARSAWGTKISAATTATSHPPRNAAFRRQERGSAAALPPEGGVPSSGDALERDGVKLALPTTNTTALASEAPVLSVNFTLGKVGKQPVSRWLMLAYDDVYSVQYSDKNLKAYWKKDSAEIGDLLKKSAAEYADLRRRCAAFDRELMADLEKAGGKKYAQLCALAYRQSLAASKLVADENGQPLFFCKENTSNGCMGTVDVFYPQAPLPLLISPSLAKAMLIPVLEYASSPRWKWPNAPHDVGTWPLANGQAYGGVKSDGAMPVEETGNMILLVAAVAQVEGNADFAAKYWPTLSKWAQYLKDYGRDPANQLCTDDFAGHLAHNANLAAKAICALGAYGKLAAMLDRPEASQTFTVMAKDFAKDWVAQSDDGDHFRLAFDQTNSWSCKYNLVWDKILDLKIFPEEVFTKEMAFYRSHMDKFGLPLDGRIRKVNDKRSAYWSKTDWAFWTACLTDNRADFDAITAPIYEFYNAAKRRVGLTDLYFTDEPDSAHMHSRPVVGGFFIKMLYDTQVWRKWAARDQTKANGPWAAIPEQSPGVVPVTPATDASPDWPATINSNATVHYFIAETNGFAATPAGPHWKPSLSFAEDGDQAFDVIHVNSDKSRAGGTNGLTGLRSTDHFMNLADPDFAVWADAPVVDVLVQVLGDEKILYDGAGNGREVYIRTGSLGHENPVNVGQIPTGVTKGKWNWILFTVANDINLATGKRHVGFLPNPEDPGVENGGVNRGTLRIEGLPGITVRAAAIGQFGAFGKMKQPNVFAPASIAPKPLAEKTAVAAPAASKVKPPAARPQQLRKMKLIRQLPAGAVTVLDQPYVKDAHPSRVPGSTQTLDLYVPPGAGKFPLLLWIHGGAWHGGDKEETGAYAALRFLPSGFAVASLDYRLSQDHAPFPAQIENCFAALVWLRNHAAQYHLAADKIGVLGHSAGAHLAALMATTGDTQTFVTNATSTRVQAAVMWAAPFDLDRERGGWPRDTLVWNPNDPFWAFYPGGKYDQDFARRASPAAYVHSNLPPLLIVHGGKDRIVPGGQAGVFARAVKQAGNAVTLRMEPEYGHDVNRPESYEEALRFFEKTLK